jgi:O-acetyl-ADP-ribose deacetylase (regulator of RNase III)
LSKRTAAAFKLRVNPASAQRSPSVCPHEHDYHHKSALDKLEPHSYGPIDAGERNQGRQSILLFAFMSTRLQLTLCDLRKDCIAAIDKRFAGVDCVVARMTDITKLRCDAWATAGNSFGDMGGGVDRAIDGFFSGLAQAAVQEAIRRDFFNELPVGSAVVVRPSPNKPILIYAPTMRVPGSVGTTINAYLAMRAILIAATKEGVRTLACPTLGTGVGGLTPDDAADQMFQAYRMIIMGEFASVAYCLQAPYAMR